MKKLILTIFLITAMLGVSNGETFKTIYNPFTRQPDYLNNLGSGLKAGDIFYLFNDGLLDAYYVFDGDQLCLYVNAVLQICYPSTSSILILESGVPIFYEDGTTVELE